MILPTPLSRGVIPRMYTLWIKFNKYWERAPYSPRGRDECQKLAEMYLKQDPDLVYQIAPLGLIPSWVMKVDSSIDLYFFI